MITKMKKIFTKIYNWIVKMFSSKNEVALNELTVEEDSTSECNAEICERPHVEVEEKPHELEVQFKSGLDIIIESVQWFNSQGILPTLAMVEFQTGIERKTISKMIKDIDKLKYHHVLDKEGKFRGRGIKYIGVL